MICIDIQYIAPSAAIDRVRPAHRAYLQQGYDQGKIYASGPCNQKTGGFIITSMTQEEAEAFIAMDPFFVEQVAQFSIKDWSITQSTDAWRQMCEKHLV